MQGTEIELTNEPRGRFLEGIVSGTPVPGVAMQFVLGVAAVNGGMTYQVYSPSADGDPRLMAILLEDHLQGKTYLDAYVTGTRCFMYCPLPGDEMNIQVPSQQGTGSANAYTVGERLIAQHNTGAFIVESTSSVHAEFTSMEHYDAPVDAIGWVWAMRQ